MFHRTKLNNCINNIYKNAFNTVYGNYESFFDQLLLKDNSFKIYCHNLQKLAVEIFKLKHNIASAPVNIVIYLN